MSDQPETTSKPKTRKNAAHADTDGATPPAPAGEARELPSIDISSEMRTAYRDYSMSVIVGRALPDVRDGLKPVHRRILYAMYDQNLLSSQKFSKCAGTVGEVLKKYHPHGDAAVYDALVRLAQNWNMGLTLVDGQGNFGSVDGDPAAAYRYTEARLTKVAESLLEDIEQRTVDFTPNFDGSHQEPTVLPARIPNLLVNGSEGIAVAMATRCPPHNLNECINALLAMISEQYEGGPVVDTPKLMQLMPGPDFPTGGMICGREGIAAYYETGRGTLKLRGKVRLEDNEKNKRTQIIVDEIPFQVNKARLVERIAELVRDKVIEGIAEIRDESDRDGMRIALDLKRDAVGEIVLNQLFKRTPLQTTFSVNMLAIVDGQPRTLSMRELLLNFIDFRREVVTRRSRFQLDEAERRYHVLAGLIVALDDIDKIIDIIRSSPNTEEAKARLCAEKFKNALKIGVFSDATTPQIGGWLKQKHAQLDEIQAQAILEMRLARLVGLERDKLLNEAGEILKDIARLRDILGNLSTLIGVIKEELLDIRTRFTTPRRCRITDQVDEISVEDLIVDEEMLVTITNSGYIKRIALSNYRTQKRGGKGKSAAKAKEEDFVADAFVASTHAYLLVFTSRGRVYWLKVHQVPEVTAQARGRAIVNLINIDSDEKVCAVVPVRRFPEKEDEAYVVTCTKNGTIKKTDLTAYSNPRSTGLIACSIDNGDELLAASITDGKSEILLSTAEGLAIRFPESDVRPMGRGATGVRAISLREADLLVGVEIVASNAEGKSILSVTEGGYGKRTDLAEYRSQSRGGIGIITIKTTDRRGRVAGVIQVHDGDQIMLITNRGTLIRVRADDVRESGRNTQGVKLINVADDERVISIKRIAEPEEEDENGVAGAAGALNGAANSANGATNGATNGAAGGGKAAGKDTDA